MKKKDVQKAIEKISSLKETILICVVVVAAVVYVAVSSFSETGLFVTDGYFVSGNDIQTNLTSGGEEQIDLNEVSGSDIIYSRWGSIYAGDEKKTKVNTQYPMFVSGGNALRFFNGDSFLLNKDFNALETYDKLILNNGKTFNTDGSQADLDEFIMVRLPNGFYMNAQELEIRTDLHSYVIPANSVLMIHEEELAFYVFRNGKMYRGINIPDLSMFATVRIAGLEMSYEEFLYKLGIYSEGGAMGNADKESEEESTTGSEEESSMVLGEPLTAIGQISDSLEFIEGGEAPDIITGDAIEPSGTDRDMHEEEYAEEVQAESSGKSSKKSKNSSGSNGGSGGADVPAAPAPAQRPEAVSKPPEVPTAKEPETTAPAPPAEPKKGEKKAVPPSSSSGLPEDPEWEEPSVIAGDHVEEGVYSLTTWVTINDPSSQFNKRGAGVQYIINIVDENGKIQLVKRQAIEAEEDGVEQEFLIDGLQPERHYQLTGNYTFLDNRGQNPATRVFQETMDFHTRSVRELGALYLEDLQLISSKKFPDQIELPHLKFTKQSDKDALAVMTRMVVRIDETQTSAKGYEIESKKLNKLKNWTSTSFLSKKELSPDTDYKVSIICYDQYYNELRVEDPDGKNQWKLRTCLEKPKAVIEPKVNDDTSLSLKVTVENPAGLEYSDLKLQIQYKKEDGKYAYLKLDGSHEYLIIESGQTITIPSPGADRQLTAVVKCTTDTKDGLGNTEREIGTKVFDNSNLDELGSLYLNVKNLTKSTVEAEAEEISDLALRRDKLKEKSTRAVLSVELDRSITNPALYDTSLNLVTTFKIRLASAEETFDVSLTEDERKALMDGEGFILDTNDLDRFPVFYGGLQGNTEYSVSLHASHWFDEEGSQTRAISVVTSFRGFRTALMDPDVELSAGSVAFFQGFIYMDIKINDPNKIIKGDTALLKIYETDTKEPVGSFRITKDEEDWYQLRLTSSAEKSTGGVAYNIKANTDYTCSFVAEEANTEDGYQIMYEFYSFNRVTGSALSGKVYSRGLLQDPEEADKYLATIGYDLNVPEDAPKDMRQGNVYITEYKNTRRADGTIDSQEISTRKIPFDENGLHETPVYTPVETGSALQSYTEEELAAELAKGADSNVREYVTDAEDAQYGELVIPERYTVQEYVQSNGYTYIDTAYHPTEKTSVTADIQLISQVASDYGVPFGKDAGGWTSNSYGMTVNSSAVWSEFSNDSTYSRAYGNPYGKRHLFRKVKNVSYVDNTLIYTHTASKKVTSDDYTLYISAMNRKGTAQYTVKQRVYEFKIWQEDVLVRDYVPCYDTVSEQYGLYEVYTQAFFAGQGQGVWSGSKESGRYYFDNGFQTCRLVEVYTPSEFVSQVEKNNITTDTYSYEMYFLYMEGSKDYEAKVPISSVAFTTDEEIYTIASGDEFVTKGANAKKYVVINDISYDNRDRASTPLNLYKANVDFQGFTFTTVVNCASIVNTSSLSAKISNMVLKTTAGRLSVAGTNTWNWNTYYRGGALFATWKGQAENLYIEFSQESYPYVYNRDSYSYWSTLSPEEMAELPSDDARNNYKFKIQQTISSFVVDNYGSIENYVVDLKTKIVGTDYVGGLACANVSGGSIRNGYVFSSVGAAFGNYAGQMELYHGYGAARGSSTECGMGGVVAYEKTNAVIENCYVMLNMLTFADAEISRHVAGIVGMTNGSTAKINNSYFIGTVKYQKVKDGVVTVRVFDQGFGPAVGRLYSGCNPVNIYYVSGDVFSNTANTPLSSYALANVDWQQNILNHNGQGFEVKKLVDVGYYPQVKFTSDVLPVQTFIPLSAVSSAQTKTDVAYSYDQTDGSVNASVQAVLDSENYGNEAWDFTEEYWTALKAEAEAKDAPLEEEDKKYVQAYQKRYDTYHGKKYYNSNEQVICILLSEIDETKIVYSVDIEHFALTHDDILYQHKDGSGIISLYVRLHDPDSCLSQYRIKSITYSDIAGLPDQTVILSGIRYANTEYYKQIWTEAKTSGGTAVPDSWEAMVTRYKGTTFPENMILKEDLDLTGMKQNQIEITGTYTGKLNGNNKTVSNIGYDSNLASTLGIGSYTMGVGLINVLQGSVWDLTLDKIHLEGGYDAGGLCAQLVGGSIDHVFIRNSYIGGGRLLGGITGYVDGGSISNSGVTDTKIVHNSGSKYSGTDAGGHDYFTGGLIGELRNAKVKRSFAQNIYLESMNVDYNTCSGGLVGYLYDQYSYIDGCYATGTILSNNDFTGGLIGVTRHIMMSFTNCYSDVDIYSYNYCAGPVYGINQGGAESSGIVTFGNVLQAIEYERGSADIRKAKFVTSDYAASISYQDYISGKIFDKLSAAYYSSTVDYANGVLPHVTDEDGAVLPNQNDEYLGGDYSRDHVTANGLNIDSSSLVVNSAGSNAYSLSLSIYHCADVEILGFEFGFQYADDMSGMKEQTGKVKSFTETEVLRSTGGTARAGSGTVTTLTYSSLVPVAAYDRYFVTAVRYRRDGQVYYQRVGQFLQQIPQQWKTVSSVSEWKGKVYGTHCENFKITGDLDFTGETIVYSDNTANNIVNRLVGTRGTSEEFGSYKTAGAFPYYRITNYTAEDSRYELKTPGFWQRTYTRGLVSVVNSELGYLGFDTVNVTSKYSTYGVFGSLLGNGHDLHLTDVHVSSTGTKQASFTGFISYLKDGLDRVYVDSSTLSTKGTHSGLLVAYIHPYTHNNNVNDVTIVNCTAQTAYGDLTTEVAIGLLVGCTYRSWGLNCGSSPVPKFNSITAKGCTVTTDGKHAGVLFGTVTGQLKDAKILSCQIENSGYIAGLVCGFGAYFRMENVEADKDTAVGSQDSVAHSSGYLGALAGMITYYNGVYGNTSADVYVKNCTVKNTTVEARGSHTSKDYLWNVGGLVGYLEINASGADRGFIGNTVENVTVSGRYSRVGGINGYCVWDTRFQDNTVTNVLVTGQTGVGGLQGTNAAGRTCYVAGNKVTECTMLGVSNVGGLMGAGGMPALSNQVTRCTMAGTEYNTGGAVGYMNCYNTSYAAADGLLVRKDGGNYSAIIKNCYIYGKSYVGGGIGTLAYRYAEGILVDNCEIRGYYGVAGLLGRNAATGTVGNSDERYYSINYCYAKDSFITEMDDETNSNLLAKFGFTIPENAQRAYFGGGIGVNGLMQYCEVDNCMIAAPNSNYVGGLQGYYYIVWNTSSYGVYDTCYSVCRNCVVIGKDYVGGLYGRMKAGWNKTESLMGENKRVLSSYNYSNAAVTGENHVAGIAGLIETHYEAADKAAYNGKLTNVYFTGTLNATGTEAGSGIAAGLFADQAINTAFEYKVTKKNEKGEVYYETVKVNDSFQLDGVISMPSSITGREIYPILNTTSSSGFDVLAKADGQKNVYITLWDDTAIIPTTGGSSTTMETLLAQSLYSGHTFRPEQYSDHVGTDGKRKDTERFILELKGTGTDLPAQIYQKALRSSTQYSYNVAFGRISEDEAKQLMPLVKNGTLLPFGAYQRLILDETYTYRQGVPLPGKDSLVVQEQQEKYEDYIATKDYTGGGVNDLETRVISHIQDSILISASGLSKINVEFPTDIWEEELGTEQAKITFLAYSMTKGDEGYYSAIVTETEDTPVEISKTVPSVFSYDYNYIDTLNIRVDYVLSNGTEGTVGILVDPDEVTRADTNYFLKDGSVYKNSEPGTVFKDRDTVAAFALPSEYTYHESVTTDGRQYLDTGVPCLDSEVWMDFSLYKRNTNNMIMGRNSNHREFLINFNSSGSGFGYFGPAFRNNYSCATKVTTGVIYTIHTRGLTGNLAIEMGKRGSTLTTYYTNTGEDASLYEPQPGADPSTATILLGGGWSTYMYGNIYGAKLYSGNRLVRDLIPATKEKEVGMYDLVSKRFFKAATSAQFTAGGSGQGLNRGTKAYVNIFDDGTGVKALDSYGRTVALP